MEKLCYILRGLPSSGKTTVAQNIGGVICQADDYFYKDGEYNFDPNQLKKAHAECFDKFKTAVNLGKKVVVSNTNTQKWEFDKYKEYAENNGYIVFVMIVENYHNNKNSHEVPKEHVDRMRKRFDINL